MKQKYVCTDKCVDLNLGVTDEDPVVPSPNYDISPEEQAYMDKIFWEAAVEDGFAELVTLH